jgi:hypothetical protein
MEQYRKLYNEVREELMDLGMPLDNCFGGWYAEKMGKRRSFVEKPGE